MLPVLKGDAITTHLSGPKMARGVGHPTRATLARGAGGGGGLVAHMATRVKRRAKEVVGQLGVSGLRPYPKYHEEGSPGGKIPARPYLLPTVKRNQAKAMRNILRHVIRKWKRGNH